MPLPDGTLTDEEFKKVTARFITIWGKTGGRPPCRVCGSDKFFIHPALIGNRSDTPYALGAHARMPTIAIYCGDCGYVEEHLCRFFGVEQLPAGNSGDEGER